VTNLRSVPRAPREKLAARAASATSLSRRDGQASAAEDAPKPEDGLLIRLLQVADVVFARLYHKITIRSPSRLPRRGPAILVCNHTSGLDPVLIQSVCSRLIIWMMARSIMRSAR